MIKNWKSCPGHPGVEFYEHLTRKDATNRKPDRYYRIRYSKGTNKTVTSGLGWSTEGFNEKKATDYRTMFIQNILTGTGPTNFKEYKEHIIQEEITKKEIEKENAKFSLTCEQIFDEYYFKYNTVKPNTKRTELGIFNNWIRNEIGNLSLAEIKYDQLQKVKNKLDLAKSTPRFIQYTFSIFRHLFNIAIKHEIYNGKNPLDKNSFFKIPKVNNRKERFLTHEEAEILLTTLKNISYDCYMQCSIALQTGMRKTEILNLTWECIDFNNLLIHVRNTKNKGKTRIISMTTKIQKILLNKKSISKSNYVFGKKKNTPPNDISKTFNRTIKSLGFNADVIDPRSKVTFHTLRHTFASWAIQNGMDLLQLQRMLGHESITTTLIYAHLSPGAMDSARKIFENLPY